MEAEVVKEEKTKNPWQGYKYWKFKPWKKKDTGEYLKKPWRKKWTKLVPIEQVNLDTWKIFNWTVYWKKEIKEERAIVEWAKPNTPLTLTQAIYESWITPNRFYMRLRENPEAKEHYQMLKDDRRTHLKELAENTIAEWLSGNLGLTWKERVDTSIKVAEKLSKAWQPKSETENKTISINIHKSTEDIMGELKSLLWK